MIIISFLQFFNELAVLNGLSCHCWEILAKQSLFNMNGVGTHQAMVKNPFKVSEPLEGIPLGSSASDVSFQRVFTLNDGKDDDGV